MPTLVSLSRKKERTLWTDGEFLDWLEPGVHADLINGEKFMHSPVSLRHADLLNFLDHLLRSYLERRPRGKLYREAVAVRLGPRTVFLPDLAFFTAAQLPRLLPTHAQLAPALVVEALSRRTAQRDIGPKFTAYEAHGVREYWVLDPETLAHRFYRRAEGGNLLAEFAAAPEEIVRSGVVEGFWLRKAWLDPAALPGVSVCLEEIFAGAPL